ncbi:hypothetical protein SVIOM74S_04196 [Streptomyces violarus]
MRRSRREERELLVSPMYFARVPERLPELGAVDLIVRRGEGNSEALAYRYDVILRKDTAPATALPWLEAASRRSCGPSWTARFPTGSGSAA